MKLLKYTTLIIALYFIPIQSGSIMQVLRQAQFHVDMSVKYDSTRTESIHNYFREMVHTGFNGAMLVAHQGHIIYKNAHGLENALTGDSLTTRSSFQLASISKQFTAAAIMKLHEWNVIDYSDRVAKYIPGFPYPKITIRQLLVHRSGLMEYMYFVDRHISDKTTYITNEDVITLMNTRRPDPYYRPGAHFNYRNTNYVLLASIVEHVSGMSFPEFLDVQFFSPLEMKNSFVFSRETAGNHPDRTKGYLYKWRSAKQFFIDGVYGDKGVYSSVEDLYKWDKALYTNKILKQSTLQEAFEPGSPNRRGIKNYGFGWRIKECSDGQTIYYHPGWYRGYKTLYIRIPQTHSTVIILTNEIYNRFMSTYPYLVSLLKTESEPPA